MGSVEGTTAADLPFRGLILCCTSIAHDIRAEITKKATDLGATWKQDLTSDATHLIVGDVTTTKYRYVAKQRPDVKPMKTSFIERAHEAWVSGEDIPVYQLEVDHAFPPFTGLRLCLTNINDEQERHIIQKNAEKNGAIYHGDLTKQVTHLVAARSEGKKYQFAKQWGIKIVCLDWFYQTLERGMALDESYFSFDLPLAERGQGAWVRPTTGKRKLSEREASNKSDGRTKSDPARRKIKRAASDRLSSGSQNLWGDIMGQAKGPKPERPSEWGSDAPQRSGSKNGQDAELDVPYVNVRASMSMSDIHPEQPKKMFHDKNFHVYGFNSEKESKIRDVIRSYDGNTFAGLQELFEASASRYVIIVPDTYVQADCPRISDASRAVQIVTFWWLERSLHEDKFIEPDEYPLGRPMKRHNIPEFQKMTISVTRFDGVDYLHYTKAIGSLGAEFCEKVFKSRSMLLVNSKDRSGKNDKTNAAEAWRIPMVSHEWLLECISEGEFVPYKKYILNKKPIDEAAPTIKTEVGANALEGCAVKLDSAVEEDRDKLEQAVFYLGGLVVSSFDSEIPITHFVTTASSASNPSRELIRAWRIDGCFVVTEIWLKMSMKKKERSLEHRYLVKNPKPYSTSSTTPRKSKDVRNGGSGQNSLAQDSNPQQSDSENPFTIEEIDVQPDIDNAADRLLPLSISPLANEKKPHTYRSQSTSVSTTPSKSKIMTLKTPSKRSPVKQPILNVAPPLETDKPAANGRRLLQNNLTEILRLAKQENKTSGVPRRPPRKFQGRANSASESGLLGNDSNSLPRSNSLKSAAAGESIADDSNNKNDSLSRTNSNTLSNNLDFGESMVYDSNHESGGRRGPHSDFDPPSQAIHYIDTDAEAERKKLFEKLALTDDGGDMKGRKVFQSTVSAQELGGPVPRRTRRLA
ncbi:hypothetical protein H072_7019 [Dactylellina haptotyla CBS 200.50]|uniref:BRCT domain-containing protein n=1 Tax=Dactylellina haptotyla (strain CBS 200.50) TaxID=1284197 RepID=S8A893_DACHA|nr:hypothetical protein H072_7019 [Dactylellina haptotyla CBS 200.50]